MPPVGRTGAIVANPFDQPRRSTPIIVAAALALVATVAVVGLVVNRDGAEAASGACSGDTDLRITASAPVAGVLKGYADDFDDWVDGRSGLPCTTTRITSASPQEFSASLTKALDGDTKTAPTTWVPDSSQWSAVLSRDPRLAQVLPRTYPVVAATPVVFAAPRPMAEALGWPKTQPSWAQLSAMAADPAGWASVKHPEWGRMRLEWPNPLTSTAGLGSTVAVYRDLAAGAEATDDLRRRLVTAHNAVGGATSDLSGALAALRKPAAKEPARPEGHPDRARDRAGGRGVQRGQAGRRGRGHLPAGGLDRQRGPRAGTPGRVGQPRAAAGLRGLRRLRRARQGAGRPPRRGLARRTARLQGRRRCRRRRHRARSTPPPSRARTSSPGRCRTGPPWTAAGRCSSSSTPPVR